MDKQKQKEIGDKVLRILKKREVLAAVAVLLGLLLLSGGREETSYAESEKSAETVLSTAAVSDSRLLEVKSSLEKGMEETLSLIRGVGAVKVSLYIASSIETVYETELTEDKSLTEENDADGTVRRTETGGMTNAPAVVSVNGDESALIALETGPELLGAVVVAEGVWDSGVKEEVFEAVKVLTGLPAHKIVVLDRKDG